MGCFSCVLCCAVLWSFLQGRFAAEMTGCRGGLGGESVSKGRYIKGMRELQRRYSTSVPFLTFINDSKRHSTAFASISLTCFLHIRYDIYITNFVPGLLPS